MTLTMAEIATDLFTAAANHMSVDVLVVTGHSRGNERSQALRQIVWYVLRHRFGLNNGEIGRFTGHDSSTVSYGIKRAKSALDDRDPSARVLLSVITAAIPGEEDDSRYTDTLALLATAERLAPIIEALGHGLASMGHQLSEEVGAARLALEAAERFRRGAA